MSYLKYALVLLVAFLVTGCEKETPIQEELINPQLVSFKISPKDDYSGLPNSYFINIKLSISRRTWTNGDAPVWDTIIRKLRQNSVQAFEVSHLIKKTDHSTGILSASGYTEYFYNDDIPYWAEGGTKQLEYSSRSHEVEVKF